MGGGETEAREGRGGLSVEARAGVWRVLAGRSRFSLMALSALEGVC